MSNPAPFEDVKSLVVAQLSSAELVCAVAYVTVTPIPAGSQFPFPGVTIKVEEESHLAFVDADPMANWGHPCRYVVLGCQTGATRSFPARLPPFKTEGGPRWRIAYKALSLPDSAVIKTQ